ncbi:TPA: head decoration protein [Pseudomonas aeruginosa]|nr:head decoration protein [Pseudomonas aeruginosa]HEJ5828900.1 head decoration protein [Pseudomonas aeruginosa]HEJ5937863.1 head decoration protein [Pseudomonas aeruginosa]HEK0119084.1 head decoration protein [Pseudomonas aeruginosa]
MPNPERNTYQPDHLLAGDFPIIKEPGVIAAGQVLTRGAVLGRLTASGEYQLAASAATDGSQTPVAILDEDIDTSAGPAPGVLMLTGEVRSDALHLGTGHTIGSVSEALRPLSLFVR